MSVVNKILDFLLAEVLLSLQQLFGILGMFFIFGIILYLLSRMTRKAFHNAGFPKLDIYVTGWIGTPVHELGHAFFCLLFRHRIDEMKLFTPNSEDGSLGYVYHSYNPKSLYQSIGNFFIGAGPIIFGTFILYVLLHYLLPNHREISDLLEHNSIEGITTSTILSSYGLMLSFGGALAERVFALQNLSSAWFWLFLYLASCVASHMALSLHDLQGMGKGLLTIVLIFLTINIIFALLSLNVAPYVLKIHELSAGFMGLFILATLISVINFSLSYVVLAAIYAIKTRTLLKVR